MHIFDIFCQIPDHFQFEIHIVIIRSFYLLRNIPLNIEHGAVIPHAHDQLLFCEHKPQVYIWFLLALRETELDGVCCQPFKTEGHFHFGQVVDSVPPAEELYLLGDKGNVFDISYIKVDEIAGADPE